MLITLLALAAFVLAIWLLLEGAEWFTKGVLLTAGAAGAPAYTVAFLAGGVDFDNLAVGLTSALQGLPEVATGSVVGSTLFFLTGGLGIALLFVPIRARMQPAIALASSIPLAGVLILAADGILGRLEGALILVISLAVLAFILTRGELRLKERSGSLATAILRLVAALVAIAAGAEIFRWSISILLARFHLDQTVFGMLVVGAAVTLEEIPKLIGPARAGHPRIALANISGTLVFNAGINPAIIALALPMAFTHANLQGWTIALAVATVGVLTLLMLGASGRRTGAILLAMWIVLALTQVTMFGQL